MARDMVTMSRGIPVPAAPRPLRRFLHVEIDELESGLMTIGALVDDALSRAVRAVVERDHTAARGVLAGDRALNRLHLRIRQQGFHIILTQAPVARDLRNVLAVMQMGAELEHMGDHCVDIARETLMLCDLPEALALQRGTLVGRLGGACVQQLRDILGAVLRRDSVAARRVAANDDRVDKAYHAAVDALLDAVRMRPESAPTATRLLFVAKSLERIGDRVTNIAEDLVYLEGAEIIELG
jgi:phosphate transport system protein